MKYYREMFAKMFDFRGRATIRQFWLAVLFSVFINFLVELLALPFLFDFDVFLVVANSLSSLYLVVVFLPMLSLTVRRLNDTGRSPLVLLVGFLLIIGEIYLIYLLCQPSVFKAEVINDFENNNDEFYNQTYNESPQESVEKSNEDLKEDEVIKIDDSQVEITEVPKKSRLEQIKECQTMLANGEISKEDYDKRVKEILNS